MKNAGKGDNEVIDTGSPQRKFGELKENLAKPVKIVVFTQETECFYCAQTRRLIKELAALNSKIAEVYDFLTDSAETREWCR